MGVLAEVTLWLSIFIIVSAKLGKETIPRPRERIKIKESR